jgi:hypothetical protein
MIAPVGGLMREEMEVTSPDKVAWMGAETGRSESAIF